jgi:hypothetical protein
MSFDAPYRRLSTPSGQCGRLTETHGLEAHFWITSDLPTMRPVTSVGVRVLRQLRERAYSCSGL